MTKRVYRFFSGKLFFVFVRVVNFKQLNGKITRDF